MKGFIRIRGNVHTAQPCPSSPTTGKASPEDLRESKRWGPSWCLKLAHGVRHPRGLGCPAPGITHRFTSPWWHSLVCQTFPSFQRWQKKKKKKKKYTHTHTKNRAFLLGQGSGIGILSFDSHPWKRLTPSSDRGCICCCLKPKGETSNSPCCYGLPGAHCPLPRRCLLTQPLPASHFKALAHHLWSSFISSAWLLRKPAQENVVTGLRLKKKKAEVGLCSQSFNSQTRATISSLQLTVLWESSEVAFSLSGS